MAATTWHTALMEQTLKKLHALYSGFTFTADNVCRWSPANRTVYFIRSNDERHIWSLLHETGHALLSHSAYRSDIELLHMETAAWEQAKDVARSLQIIIDEEHVQNCLDTYRNWLFARSTCPRCLSTSLQTGAQQYQCFNCKTIWRVSRSRFCRIYRTTLAAT